MSATEDKSSNNEEETEINQDAANQNTGFTSVGIVTSLDSNKNAEVIAAITENLPQLDTDNLKGNNKGAGDTTKVSLDKNKNKEECDSTTTLEESLNIDSGKGRGDSIAKIHVSDECEKNNDNTDLIKDTDDDDKNFKTKNEDDSDQNDDDMKLRWDDDDAFDQVLTDNDETFESAKDSTLSEEQLLAENTEDTESSEIVSVANPIEKSIEIKETEENLEESKNDVDTGIDNVNIMVTDNADNEILDKIKEVTVSNKIMSGDIPLDGKAPELSPATDTPIEKSVDNNEDSEADCQVTKIILAETSVTELHTEAEQIQKTNEDENLEVQLFLESVHKRVSDAVERDKVVEESELLEGAKNIKALVTDVSMEKNQDESNDALSEEKLLEEPEIAETEIDISMEKVDDVNEEELLGNDHSQDALPMDVDVTDSENESKPINETTIKEVDNPLVIETQIKSNPPENETKATEMLALENISENIENKSNESEHEKEDQVAKANIVKENTMSEKLQSDSEKLLKDDTTDSILQETNEEINTPLQDSTSPAHVEHLVKSNIPKDDKTNTVDLNSTTPTGQEIPVVDSKTPTTNEIPVVDSKTPTSNKTTLVDSPIQIKTDHSLHKPDAMLEIPSQELIDIDEADLSMNIDQPTVDSQIDKNADVVKKTTADKGVVEKSEDVLDNVDKDSGKETVEEGMEKMFANEDTVVKDIDECEASTSQAKPSTSFNKMTPDTADEVPEVSDSLGLLAESSGRMMDDDEPEDDDDGDDDDDFDQDESSNQISAEQSEDSNAPHSETEPARDQDEKEIETPENKEEAFQFSIDGAATRDEKIMEVDMESKNVEEANDEETKSAVDALLKSDEKIPIEENKKSADIIDTETVRVSDTSDNEVEDKVTKSDQTVTVQETAQEKPTESPKQSPSKESTNKSVNQSTNKSSDQSPKQSPSKIKKLEITTLQATDVVSFVDLEESSSSEDDIQEVKKPEPESSTDVTEDTEVTKVNIPTGIEIMCTGSTRSTSEMVTKEGEVVISGIPKPPPHKPARLNTSEVSIKTVSAAEPMVIPETKINEPAPPETPTKPKLSLEIFSLDSDDEDSSAKEKPAHTSPHKMTALELEKARETSKCINYCCTSDPKEVFRVADAVTMAYYDAGRKRRAMVCQTCADVVANRTKNLIEGIKDMTPLLQLEMSKLSQDLVEISDSESEDEDNTPDEPKESIGEKGAKFVQENLIQLLNDTWKKYDMDTRLKDAQITLDDEIQKLEMESKEIDDMLNECQVATDKLRCDLYATFEHRRQELPAMCIVDTPDQKYVGFDLDQKSLTTDTETRQSKRRLSSAAEHPPKRPAIPLGYTPLDADASQNKEPKPASANLQSVVDSKLDDDKDISVVKLSAESAPADLPPPGEISRPPLRVGMSVYAMKNAFGPWLKGKVLELQAKNIAAGNPFSLCRVKFDHKAKNNGKVLPARCIAYAEPADVRMTIGTRLIALFKDSNKRESYYSGVVAEIPNPVNNYRYLVFFDDGYAQYVQHTYTRLVCECSHLVWEEVHPFSREFVREYLMAYPERPMVRLHEGQHLKTEWNGKWWSSKVIKVDASLAQVMFVGDGRREWIYRGSTRLAPLYLELRAAERHRPRPMPRSKAQPRSNMPYVEYTRSDEQENKTQQETQIQQQQNEEIRRQRAVAKKSTSVPAPAPPLAPASSLDTVTSRVVYYTPKNAVKPFKMTPHKCGPKCKRSDVLSLKELRTYNPLAKPLLSGWERQIVRFKGHREVMYRAPCGRRVRNMRELHHYLRSIDSDLPVDLFDFHHGTHCLAEFVLNKCLVGKKDLSHGKENVPVPCVNYYDDSLPEFCSYNTERTPTAGVPLNIDPEFLCGCDCTDDCQDKSKCACWKMTLEGARTIGLDAPNVGYVYKRLPEPLPSGIYECNSRCKCKHTCLNRVAQHPLQLKLQVFKTPNRGWGIRALNDVPKGSFLCVYAGNLLTDATANLDGLNEGDEYLAELDYIEVVEQMKEGYEEDIPEADKKLDKKEKGKDDEDEEEDEPSSSEDDDSSKTDRQDDDFRPGYIGLGVTEFSKRLRRREKKKDKEAAKEKEKESKDKDAKEKDSKEPKDSNADEDCITISDDEEVREPSRFMVQAGMGANEFISKYKSVRTLFGEDEACYIMDAKVQGNIGRYLNHSCCPNVFVQNVFVDTHDPRFPWVAFFALSHIKAGTELTWNYNYDVGSVPGKILYCYCGAPTCRGRLL